MTVLMYSSSCGGPDLSYLNINEINKVVIVSVQADSKFQLLNTDNNLKKHKIPNLVPELTEEEKFYLFDHLTSLKHPIETWIKQKGFTLIPTTTLNSSKTLNSTHRSPLNQSLYALPPYKPMDSLPINSCKLIVDELDVDAIIMLKITFKKSLFRDPLQLPLTPDKLKLISHLMITVVDKSGNIIIEEIIEGISSESIDHYDYMTRISVNDTKLVKSIDNSLINLKQQLIKYLGI